MALKVFVCLFLSLIANQLSATSLEEVVVVASKTKKTVGDTANSISVLRYEDLIRVSPVHINELLQRTPGVWISRGNGQESLTSVRSPVLTGAGSCGAFLVMQDGVSLRAPGFCNVNQLFEGPNEIAERIEVFRGPNSSVYGSNAVHGVINIITPVPGAGNNYISIETGPDDFYRSKVGFSTESVRVDFSGSRDDGYKNDSGYGQQKLLVKHSGQLQGWEINSSLFLSNLNQETAGFITGFEAYRVEEEKKKNPNPEAYRDAYSLRIMSDLSKEIRGATINIQPYLRSVGMEFLQHFLPGQPEERNGHDSLGLSLVTQSNQWWSFGADIEFTQGFLKETQESAVQGSRFLSATLPPGKHYDYEVDASLFGLFIRADHPLSEKASITGGVRFQYTNYRYDNKMINGRTKEDGTTCGFGGCRFSRPSDREDSFSNLSPNIGFIYKFNSSSQAYASLARGFRAPQTTELYRLQNQQEVANIDEVELDSIEIGFRSQGKRSVFSISAFSMKKDNFIFRDTQRQNVDSGETSHQGLELALDYQINPRLSTSTSFTYAEHQYDNNPGISRDNIDGNIIDTAPKTLGSARLSWEPIDKLELEFEWVHIGSYFQDPGNQHKYPGHDLFHLRTEFEIDKYGSTVFAHFKNLGDKDYAERADFAFGSHRYFVGTPRSIYLGYRKSF